MSHKNHTDWSTCNQLTHNQLARSSPRRNHQKKSQFWRDGERWLPRRRWRDGECERVGRERDRKCSLLADVSTQLTAWGWRAPWAVRQCGARLPVLPAAAPAKITVLLLLSTFTISPNEIFSSDPKQYTCYYARCETIQVNPIPF